jgi:hypothetical protein
LEGRDPAPGIDLHKLSLATGLQGQALLDRVFDEVAHNGRIDASYAMYSFEELELRQKKFLSKIKMEFYKVADCTNNRCLVFVQAGRGLRRHYLRRPRLFDVLVNYYETPPDELAYDADIVVYQPGTKTTAINSLLTQRPEVLLRYDAVLFLDDDIEISVPGIENVFQSMQEHDLALAQPALSEESDCVWSIFRQPCVGDRIRLVNGVEIMMPALTRKAMVECGWVFGASISGFGTDLLLGKACFERFGGKAGVVGTTIAVHEKKIDERGGAFYNYMRSEGINPKYELWKIVQRYSVVPHFHYLDDFGGLQSAPILTLLRAS